MKRSQNVGNILQSLCKASVRQDSFLCHKEGDSNCIFICSFISFFCLIVRMYHDHCLQSVLRFWYYSVPQSTSLDLLEDQKTKGEMGTGEGEGNVKALVSSGTHISFSRPGAFL